MSNRLFSTGLFSFGKTSMLIAALVAGAFCATAKADDGMGQLNQIFRLDVPAKVNQSQWWVGGQVSYADGDNDFSQFDFRGFGTYGLTNEISLNANWGYRKIDVGDNGESGITDFFIGGQYKLNQFINPDIAHVSVQLDVGVPLASASKGIDKGKWQLEPAILAYKGFGAMGPGKLGAYAELGANLCSKNNDLLWGGACTCEIEKFTIIAELFGDCKIGGSEVDIIPGVCWRGIDRLELTAGLGFGLTDVSPNWGLFFKANYSF